jgi:hypothetical protein
MSINQKAWTTHPGRFQSFIIFEPASIRVSDSDIFILGKDVQTFYDRFMEKLLSKKLTIKEQILQNKVAKIGSMLELLQNYDQVIISKFFDRIWRRYSYISHLGESFLDLETFLAYCPEYKEKLDDVIALRFDKEVDTDDEASDESEETSDEDSDESAKDEKVEKEEKKAD